MEQLLYYLVSYPRLFYTICGMLGGIVGFGLGTFLAKILNMPTISRFVAIICIVLAVQAPKQLLPQFERQVFPTMVVDGLQSKRFFALIFKLHPEAENEVKIKLKQMLIDTPDNQVLFRSQAIFATFFAKYVNQYLIYASDQAIYNLLQHQLVITRKLQNRPHLCVSYNLGHPQLTKEDIAEDLVNKELELKADIIESAVNQPSLPSASSPEALGQSIALAYKNKGYDINHLSQLTQVETLPRVEGCNMAIEFLDALVSMPPKEAAYVYKNLIYMGQT